ncbi:condensin-2 complex subunit D3 [Punica granatum]|uniref:Condensin complex subunit 1 C-terminal domain-containing protein n=2 Tax=Punica granatum TaxID=22663 RepID=A0A218WEY6_PUNGR|nr:condensin-2 complex subunit D3 [Punica granatum]OWM71236.1 hypothetical protein CDL15_Pgr011363 [Punica granatum]PKI65094.1 hypothetical protein CRG98_014563 [Punica granatum]
MADDAILSILTELEGLQNRNLSTPLAEQTLHDLHRLLHGASDDPETMVLFYEGLASRNIAVSSLTQSISSVMEAGPGPGSTRISLLASDVYLSLILAPTAPVFTLFNPVAFLSLLHSVRRFFKSRPAGQPDEPGSGSSGGRKRGGGRVRKSQRGSIVRDGEGSEFGILVSVLKMLELVMDLIHLDRFLESLKCLIQTVAEIPVLSLDSFPGSGNQYCKLTELCSRVLCKVLRPEHGEVAESAAEVLKSLCPMILLGKSQARNFALSFVKDTMMGLTKEFDGVQKAVINLPKYLAHKAPEKAEPRALAVESIMEVVRLMEHSAQIGFVEYVVKMSEGKSNLRLLGVDLLVILMILLGDTLLENEDSVDMEMRDLWLGNCLQALLKRCSDSSSVIRARALSNLAQMIGHFLGNGKNISMFKEVLGLGEGQSSGINELLRKRCVDEKAAVRRAAINLVTKLTALMGGEFDINVLKTLGMACSDPLVSIRKAAISALSEAFRNFPHENVAIEWLHSVPRLISDNETSLQEESENLFLELVLDRVSTAGGSSADRVLTLLQEICHGEVVPWVKKVCTNLGKKNRLRPRVALTLQNIIRESESLWLSQSMPIERWTAPQGAWFLLSEVSAYVPKSVEWEFLHHYWQLLDKSAERGETQSFPDDGGLLGEYNATEPDSISWASDRVFLLQTISNVSLELPSGPAADLAQKLLKQIGGFNMHPTEVKAHVKALRTLCKQKASSQEEAEALVLRWVNQLLSEASGILEKYVSEEGSRTNNKEPNFFTPPRSKNRSSRRQTKSLSRATNAVYTIGSLLLACPSADTSTIIPTLHTIITSGNLNTDPKLKKLTSSSVSFKQIAPSLYIQAWVTMGKICLADGKLAKRYIPLFMQELEKSDLAALRNNLVVVMADFCVRYTALVDCYITKITRCLCDPCELVRRQTFILMSRLLQRDYVKWRGVLFLRFLLSLVDESEKIRQLSDYLFGNILKVKAPLLAYNSFVEAVFVLNDCRAHSGHFTSQGPRAENRVFSIRGNDEISRSKRMHIYISLLKQMAPEHLLATFAKICAEILAAASDGMLNIEDLTGQSVLQDAFRILACKEIRIPTSRGAASDSPEIEEDVADPGASSSSAAKGRAISQAVRKGLIQNMIPIFIELKRLLEAKNSPLIGSLMDCLRLLLKDYRNEIEDMLVADRQLQKELVYDMQKHEAAARARPEEASTRAAEATARSVLREVNRGIATPPLKSLSVPKVKDPNGGMGPTSGGSRSDRPREVLESLRRKQPFIPDGED